MRGDSPARMYAVLGIGLVIAVILTMFLHVAIGLHMGAASPQGPVNGLQIWMAPLGLYGIAAIAAVMLAWVPAPRLARAAAAAGLIWPVCVILAVTTGINLAIPILLSTALLMAWIFLTRSFR